ncbi:MAG: PKD domain-containing protein [Candidatus Eisenbacteria bacterium]|uniref:PKD domain-containing protein n=1 Tax=Eiseniibacteriota bacterium TaxID=2212470 RepID=A0A849SR63_UNCEI|nr:PKD domain-containing protein [Candidatus Eisenbacteria bacterium]
MRRGTHVVLLVALLALSGARPLAAQCFQGELATCGAECSAWQLVSGAVAPGFTHGLRFRAGGGCQLTFSFCQPNATAAFATTISVWDSTCTEELASAGATCDTLSELSWAAPYPGAFVVKVGTQGEIGGSYTLAYRCECSPTVFSYVVGGAAYQGFSTQFDGTASFSYFGDISSYDWTFGDGGQGSGPTTSHVYSQEGTYFGQLEVTDPCGNTAIGPFEVNVRDCDANPPMPPLVRRGDERRTAAGPPPPRQFGLDIRATLSPGPEVIGAQSMAVDTLGNVHLAYGVERFPPYFGTSEASIYHRVWSATTQAWLPETLAVFIPPTTRQIAVAVAADSLFNLHVVWSQLDVNDDRQIFYVRRDTSGNWSAPFLIRAIPDQLSSAPVIAADLRGNVHVAWAEGDLSHSNVFQTTWSATTQSWNASPQQLTNLTSGRTTDVSVTIEEVRSPAVGIAHFGWTQFGSEGEGVAHRMVMIKPSGQSQTQASTDFIPAFSPCGLAIGSSNAGLHLLFDTCFDGRPPSAIRAGGGPQHYVGVTTPGPPNGWPTFSLAPESIPSGLKGGIVSTLATDRFGDLHAITGRGSDLTYHAQWSAKDSLWMNGDPVRDVASGFILTTGLAVDHEHRAHAVWLDHRAPDSPCSGELYHDLGICTPPQLPESLRVTNVGTGHQLQLEWQPGPDSTASASRYIIYRALAREAVYDSVADVAGPSWLDPDFLIRGASYTYRILPYNLCGERGDTTAAAVGIPRFPLVMVHGCCLAGFNTFATMNQYLTTFGPEAYAPQDVSRVEYDSWGHLIDGAGRLSAFVDSLTQWYGSTYGVAADTVDIVAHSMGGLVSRIFVQGEGRRVGTLVTLGSPHAGTSLNILLAAQLLSLLAQRTLALPLFEMSYPYMRLVNNWLKDTPHTGTPWTQCSPPSYRLGAGLFPNLDPFMLPNVSDGLVPLFSALYPHGCQQQLFAGVFHPNLPDDLTNVAPWVRDRLLEDSLGTGGFTQTFAPGVESDSSAIADSLPLRPVALIEGHSLQQGEAVSDTVALDEMATAWFGTFHFEGAATLTLRDPSGQIIDPAYAAGDPQIDYLELPGDEGTWQSYRVTTPAAGAWSITTTATTLPGASAAFVNFCTVESPVRADLVLPARVLLPGETLSLVVVAKSGTQALPDCTVAAQVVAPNSSATLVPLFDDGAHGDGAAGDGIYGSTALSLPMDGDYAVQATVAGTVAPTGAFTRRSNGVIMVGDRVPPAIGLQSPIGGERYRTNSAQLIQWNAADDTGIDSLRVELSMDDGATYARVGSAPGTDSTFAWMTPDSNTVRARIRVTAFDALQQTAFDVSPASFTISDAVDAPVQGMSHARPALTGVFPNPFRASTTLEFSLPQRAHVRLTVHDVAGRRVRTVVDEVRGPGRHRMDWKGDSDSGRRISSGVYFVQLDVGATRVARKLLLVK